MTQYTRRCPICGLENHATVDEYKKIILEIMIDDRKRSWSKEEIIDLANKEAAKRVHQIMGLSK